MVKRPTKPAANHLRAWRIHAGLSQEQLAALSGTAGNVISLLESGQRKLSDEWLKRLAPHLGCKPKELRDRGPLDEVTDILDLWAQIPEDRRDEVREMMQIFTRSKP